MGWDNSGNFVRRFATFAGNRLWDAVAQADRNITSDDHDAHDQDLATGINNCLTKDGQNTPTRNLPMGGFKHTNVNDAANDNEYATFGQLKANRGNIFIDSASVGGTANAITLTPDNAITSYEEGYSASFVAKRQNTGAVTVNVSGLGAKNLVKFGQQALASGDFTQNMLLTIVYDGDQFNLVQVIPPSAPTQSQSDWNEEDRTDTSYIQNKPDIPSFPSGAIMAYGANPGSPPSGWLYCRGQQVSRSGATANLWNAIGTTYGAGNGSSTFNLPDLRGEFLRGLDSGRGVVTGRAMGSRQVDAFRSHNHARGTLATNSTGAHTHGKGTLATSSAGAHTHRISAGYGHVANFDSVEIDDTGSNLDSFSTESAGAHTHTITGATGSAGSHSHTISGNTASAGGSETRPRNVAVNYIIKI